jgi:tetratricopeptide (TPR) repeat protein
VAVVVLTAAVYAQVYTHGFIAFDDPAYVSENPFVLRGLTREGVRWAFTTGRMGNWNPVTWLSHMLDAQLFGAHPGGHHLVNVALHLINTLLLYAVLKRMTGAAWRSLVVAALFALHPLHVESVAWVSERKDTLSTLFWLLTLWAYARYAEHSSGRWYAAMLAFFALGLMCKPMLVTTPFLLLLLDIWPLRRPPWPPSLAGWFGAAAPPSNPKPRSDRSRGASGARPLQGDWRRRLWEKLPLLVIAALASGLAYTMQQQSGAVSSLDSLPLSLRIGNALVAYVRYLFMTLWPVNLAVLYPYDTGMPVWQPALAAILLLVISGTVFWKLPAAPYLFAGWFWYLGTLVPVIGLVQIGGQALADRYTYVPLIGIFVAAVWGAAELAARHRTPQVAQAAASSLLVAAGAVLTFFQVGRWRDSETLLRHTIRVTRDNHVAYNNLGVALGQEGRTGEALESLHAALRIKPDYGDAYINVGVALERLERRSEAAEQYRLALRYAPRSAEALINLGRILSDRKEHTEAIELLSKAVQLDPESANAHNNLGAVLRAAGQPAEAAQSFRRALALRPDFVDAHVNLGVVLAELQRNEEALAQFQTALRYDPQSTNARNNLAAALFRLGRADDAMAEYRAVLRQGGVAEAHYGLALVLRDQSRVAEAIEHLQEAIRLDPKHAAAQKTLGDCFVELERLADAAGAYERALALNPSDVVARYNLGSTLARSGRLPEAIEQYRRVVELAPKEADAWGSLAVAYAAVGRSQEAISAAEESIRLARAEGKAEVGQRMEGWLLQYRGAPPPAAPRE